MPSLRNKGAAAVPAGAAPAPDDALLDAARAGIVALGWRRSTLTDVARRAGVSRMTIYRRWPDMRTLLADLMTREWGALVPVTDAGSGDGGIAAAVTSMVSALRRNELFEKIVSVDPELLLPYLLQRRGRTQDTLLGLLEDAVSDGQREGSVRPGDPVLLARSVLLTAYGFAFSAPTMTEPAGPTLDELDEQLRLTVERYLAA
jgi:AcrR family transcriptional regulator